MSKRVVWSIRSKVISTMEILLLRVEWAEVRKLLIKDVVGRLAHDLYTHPSLTEKPFEVKFVDEEVGDIGKRVLLTLTAETQDIT